MARHTTSLTNTQIRQAKPRDKEYTLSDGNGLQLRVRPNGAKSWMFNYYVPITKKRNKISFGSFPCVSLACARRQRDEARELIAQNIDPKFHREEQVQAKRIELANTFKAFADEYLSIKKKTTVESTYSKREAMLENYLVPAIGTIPAKDIKPLKLRAVLDPIYKQGKVETVKRLCIIANEIMRIAVVNGAIEFNPLADLTKLYPAKKVRHNPALTPEELPELVQTIGKANIRLTTKNLILWELHTMVRPSEASKVKWSDIDFEELVWFVPIPKTLSIHRVPLTPQMLTILNDMRPHTGNREYVFTADRNPNKHANTQTANAALKRMGFQNRTTAHGLRALASTTLNAHGFNGDLIESALSHQEGNKIRRAYNHTDYLERRKPMMQWWSSRIELASKGEV
ncbi:integrase [Vibrio breoganii]|uniref:tyrosine-type recombinase/integrase n=1 Tax=Vibrio breoganii TaxID=553239 RepID=UPI000C864D8E|nr:integrase arm-type DNA-binding domain-containing protein [Vibrio breoganii]PMO60349.1 integrase [Vibrio breoganii]